MKPTPTLTTAGRLIHSKDWQIVDAPPIPGACSTDLRANVMHAPCDPGDLEQAIRGHEMIHAGWSPIYTAHELGRALNLDPGDLESAEEWRVNAIAFRAGIDSTILHDPADVANAEKLTRARQLAPVLRLIVASHGTNSHRRVLKTIRKYAPTEWEKPIADAQRAIRRARREHILENRSTRTIRGQVHLEDGSTRSAFFHIPGGYLASIDIARVLTHWRNNDPTPTRAQERENSEARDRQRRAQKQEERMTDFEEHPEFDLEGTGYESVRLQRIEHDLNHKGKHTRRRIASDIGKTPRRIDRWHSDPARRVFDRKVRARGGVVLIDQSGSMRLDRSDIDRVLEHAGGAIVIGYSNTGSHRANVWVHAQNGKRSNMTPTGGSKNDVDGPALMYAISKRENRRDPVLWVTDGRCYELSGSISPSTCAILEQVVERHGVTMVDNIDEAIAELSRLARGNHPRTKVNELIGHMANTHKKGITK